MNTPQVNFTTTDLTGTTTTPTDGISYVLGKSLRGAFNKPDKIINSWPSFIKEYGGLIGDDTSLKIKRYLEKGGLLRFCRLGHYTTIATRSTLTAVKAAAVTAILDDVEDGEELFELILKNPGLDGNNIKVAVTAPSNGQPGYFNVNVTHDLEPELNESYPNLIVEDSLDPTTATYLKIITELSKIVDVEYKALPADYIPTKPKVMTSAYTGGLDGGALTTADIIGDSASLTGFHAFDEYADSYQIMVALTDVADAVHVAGNAYATSRTDLLYWLHLENTLTTKDDIKAKVTSLGIVNEYSMIFAGGLKVTDPVNSLIKNIEAITDIAALTTKSDTDNGGPFRSFAGNRRGVITNALGVVNNFGTPARFRDMNELAQNRVNLIINENSVTKLWGCFTTLIRPSQRQFANVVRGEMYIKKALKPLLQDYLEEPNLMSTWKLMYYQVKPFLDKLVTKQALYSYKWLGDQDAKSLNDLQINDPADVTNGKYKIKLLLSFIPGMQEITVNLVLVPGNISFELADSLT